MPPRACPVEAAAEACPAESVAHPEETDRPVDSEARLEVS
mgnify:FL=1